MDKKWGAPTVTHDGVTVAKEIELEDPFADMGAQILKEAATKTNDVARDGTTTATVLAQSIVTEGLRNVAAGANPMLLKRGIDAAANRVADYIREEAVELESWDDIAHVAAISAADREIRPLERVSFYSDGHKLDAVLYTPDDYEPGETRAGVVFCVGYTYVKELVIPEMAKWLTRAGYVSLIFDYRGFGGSEGTEGRLIPAEQVADVRNAITFLTQQPHVDADRIGVVGLSLGGSHALYTAAVDPRVEVVASIQGPGDGERWLRTLRRYDEWLEFLEQLADDRAVRVLEGSSSSVDSLDIVLPDAASRDFLLQVYEEFPQMKTDLTLQSAEALVEYSPEQVVHMIAPRPLLLIHGANDRLVPVEEAQQLYRAAEEPKRLHVVPEMEHFNWVFPNHPTFADVMEQVTAWFQEHVPAHTG